MGAVLVVEVEPLIRLKVIDFLEEAGFDVIEAAYGDEAFDLLGDHSIHVIFTDIQMPGNLKGYDLAHNVARRFPDAVSSSLQEGWRRKIWSCRPTPNSSPSPTISVSELLVSMPCQSAERVPGSLLIRWCALFSDSVCQMPYGLDQRGIRLMKIEIDTPKISTRERFLEAIVQSAIDYAIISLDLDGLVTSWNEGARRILGWSAEEMVGKPASVFFVQTDREQGVPQREMTAALSAGRGSDERWHLKKDGTTFWASGEMMALRADDETVIGFVKILRDRTSERDQADRQRLLMHELGHRLKNTLSVVQSIATQSLRNATSLEDASEKLRSRIAAYSTAHDILLQKNWTGATLRNIVEAAKVNIGMEGSERILIRGPDVELGPQAALSISLVLHELLTNATKYGALSNSAGHIDTTWKIERIDGEDMLVCSWREFGGPKVTNPSRKGFGTRLILSSLKSYGDVGLEYDPAGIMVEMKMRLSKIQFRSELAQIP